MLRNISLIPCLALAVITIGCATAPTTVPAPPDTRAADVQAIKTIEAAWVKDINAKDADKFASYFTDDGSGLYPGGPTLSGKAAIKTAVAAMMADPNFAMSFQSDRTAASVGGDMVYSQGTYTATMSNPKTKKAVTDKGKFLTVYMKQADGSWKVVADTYNSDAKM